MKAAKGILLGLLLAPALLAQTPPLKPAPAEKEEPDYAFLVNSPYVEEKGEVQVIGAIRFDTRRGHPDQKFSNAFARTEWGLTDRWELDLMNFWTGADFLARGDSLAGVRYQVLNESRGAPISFSIGPQLLLPTGKVENGGTGRLGYAWDVTAGKDFGNPIFTYYSVNYAATPRRDAVLQALNWGFCLGVRPFEHDSRGRRHHDVHLYAELAGTRTQDGRDISNNNALSLGFRYGYQTEHHTLFEIGASAPLGLSHDAPNYGWIIQFQYELSTPWHTKH